MTLVMIYPSGYKRVAWPPASEERIVREFTPQPQTQYQTLQEPTYQQQHHQQQQFLQQQQKLSPQTLSQRPTSAAAPSPPASANINQVSCYFSSKQPFHYKGGN